MKRRNFLRLLGTAGIYSFAARAQQPAAAKRKIGILLSLRGQQLILKGLQQLGYVEGQNLTVDARFSPGATEFEKHANELVALKPDVLVTAGSQGALALKRATNEIPIVMTSSDPVGVGLISSLARPGGNVTGFSLLTPEISGKRLELLREAMGALSEVAILWNASDPVTVLSLKETEQSAKTAGIKTSAVAIKNPGDFGPAFDSIKNKRPDALVILPSPLMDGHWPEIVGLVSSLKLPSTYPDPTFPRAGGLMSYGPNFFTLIQSEAIYIDKIFRGAKPADLPVEQPTKFELVINLITAKALGIEVPPSLLARADEVIE